MFLENVKHILKVSKGEVFNYIVEKIKKEWLCITIISSIST